MRCVPMAPVPGVKRADSIARNGSSARRMVRVSKIKGG